MSSFLFLHFCDDALRLLGLYFSAFHPFKTFLLWFLPPPSKPPRGPHTASTGRVRSFPGAVPLPGPQNRTQGCTGPNFGFLSRTSLPLPLKGEGLDIACLGFVESALLVHNWGTLAQQGRSGGFGGVAPLLGPQNRTQGHTGASLVLACWLAILRKIAFRNPV